eukprot:534023_1
MSRPYYINNPLCTFITISKYDCSSWGDLRTVNQIDKPHLQELTQRYGWQKPICNETEKVTKPQAKNIIQQVIDSIKIMDKNNKRCNAWIFVYSGHGLKDVLITSECDSTNPKSKGCLDIKKFIINRFSKKDIPTWFHEIPKWIFLDSCQGLLSGKEAPTPRSKGGRAYVPKNWFIIYSNCSGFKSYESSKGGYLIRALHEEFEPSKTKNIPWNKLLHKIRDNVPKNVSQENDDENERYQAVEDRNSGVRIKENIYFVHKDFRSLYINPLDIRRHAHKTIRDKAIELLCPLVSNCGSIFKTQIVNKVIENIRLHRNEPHLYQEDINCIKNKIQDSTVHRQVDNIIKQLRLPSRDIFNNKQHKNSNLSNPTINSRKSKQINKQINKQRSCQRHLNGVCIHCHNIDNNEQNHNRRNTNMSENNTNNNNY